MRLGQRSLLFGVHQFVWHPLTVLIAWWRLYGWPSWRELVCIIIHDWGYWFAPNMDGPEGERHPEYAAQLAGRWLGEEYHDLCLYHSRHYSRSADREPSKLCWADKLSLIYDPWWWYLPRARASGELAEYRDLAAGAGVVPLVASDREWHRVMQQRFLALARAKRPDAVSYANKRR